VPAFSSKHKSENFEREVNGLASSSKKGSYEKVASGAEMGRNEAKTRGMS